MMATNTGITISRQLYRSLYRAVLPFTKDRSLFCLLHRSDLVSSHGKNNDVHRILTAVLPSTFSWPVASAHQGSSLSDDSMNMLLLWLREEFDRHRCTTDPMSIHQAQQVAFRCWRILQRKLAWHASLVEGNPMPFHPHQAALDVVPHYSIQPGCFLVAHPLLRGYFRRTVVLILQDDPVSGTYGLVCNQIEPHMALHQVLQPLPDTLQQALGNKAVKHGGPVHMAVQLVSVGRNGGTPLDDTLSFNGDILQAAEKVLQNELDPSSLSLFVGASTWAPRQLQQELCQGCWYVAHGPCVLAHTGQCAHASSNSVDGEPTDDLWLSMVSACGAGDLAHLLWKENPEDPLGQACDVDE